MKTMENRYKELYGMFETRKRDGGSSFVALRDSAPEWAHDFVREAHGVDMLPDDYRYRWIRDALGALADNPDSDPQELAFEFADAIDVYISDRIAWLGSNLQRATYCAQAQEEGLAPDKADVVTLIGLGQYQERWEIFFNVVRAVEALNE